MSEELRTDIEKQLIVQQFNEVQQQLLRIEEQLQEVKNLKEGIEGFAKLKKGSEMLVPLANGVFVKAQLMEESQLNINVGAGVIVEKNPEQAVKMVDNQYDSILKLRDEVKEQFEMLLNIMRQLEH